MKNKQEYSVEIGGKIITAEFNDLADQSHGSVILSSGNTVVLATAVMSEEPVSMNYFPLRVEYEERFYAAGQILGSRFMRREGRPSEEAILSGRVVDRTIRPLFNQRMRHEVQIVITVLSIGEHDPDVLAVNAASLALASSHIPWDGPVSAVRIGTTRDNGEFEINPRYDYREASDFEMDLLACGKEGMINMIEVGAYESSEERAIEAIECARKEIERLEKWQREVVAEVGKEKRAIDIPERDEALLKLFDEKMVKSLKDNVFGSAGKEGIKKAKAVWKEHVREHDPEADMDEAMEIFEEALDSLIHREALERDQRADGRALDEVRPLFGQAGGVSETLHGSGTFYRGGTHVLSVLTLGSPDDSLIIEGMETQEKKRFLHHYNFPPFSVGEVGRVGGFNRRMIGHGALAEKALAPVIPTKEDFPYTIRVVSEALASNGSTSMGSVCASTLALMDAGVPISRPVAGIAIGLMQKENKAYKILSDIQGPEDHYGDMDFKVAGTREGITAIQMDVKLSGVGIDALRDALEAGKKARFQILDVIEKEIAKPRANISPYAPHILVLKIKEDQIGLVIGAGGKTVNEIRDVTGAEISIEDDGTVYITGDKDGAQKAKDMIAGITHEYKSGEKFEGVVTRIMDFGAFVKIGFNTEGLVHISEIAPFRIEKVKDVLKEGDIIPVVIKEIDEKDRINLSLKQVDPDYAKKKLGTQTQKPVE